MINVSVLGYGTVGSGVVEILKENADLITKRAGEEIRVKSVLDLRDFPGDPVQDMILKRSKMIRTYRLLLKQWVAFILPMNL